jgi:hypothetical protein
MVSKQNLQSLLAWQANLPTVSSVGEIWRGPEHVQGARLDTKDDLYLEEMVAGNKFLATVEDGRADLPPPSFVPPPSDRLPELRPYVAHLYSDGSPLEHATAADPFERLLDSSTRGAAVLQRLVNTNEHVRAAVGKVVGGRIIADGRNDGALSLVDSSRSSGQPISGTVGCQASAMSGGGGWSAGAPADGTGGDPGSVYGWLGQLNDQILGEAKVTHQKQIDASSAAGSGGVTGPDGNVEAFDVAVFRLDTDRLEQMHGLINQVQKKHDQDAMRR